MDIGKFTVYRVSSHKQPRVVSVDGEEVMADVSMQEVELTSTDGSHGTLTLRFYKMADREAINAEIVEGGTVMLAVTKIEADEVPAAA